MRRFTVPVLLAAMMVLVGCGSAQPVPERVVGEGIVGRIEATPFGIFISETAPPASEPHFFNSRLERYEVIRALDDRAIILFFTNQYEADDYVRAMYEARDTDIPFFATLQLTSTTDYDMFAARNDVNNVLGQEVEIVLSQTTLRNLDWGDTRHPSFRHDTRTGLVTDYFVYIRDGSIQEGRRRLDVRSANWQFHSLRWDER